MASRIYAFLFFGLCVWSMALQYNDPDTSIWIAVYAVPGIAALLYGFEIKHKGVLFALAGLYLVGTLYWWPTPWPERFVDDEVAREFGGLAIIAFSMAVLGIATSLRRDA